MLKITGILNMKLTPLELFAKCEKHNLQANLLSLIPASAHPISLVFVWAAGRVGLHAVLVLHRVSRLAHVTSIVNERQGLVFHRLTHGQQQLWQLGNISTLLTKKLINRKIKLHTTAT